MIVMADVPLITVKNVREMLASPADVVISPGRGGGTNVQYIKEPGKYHVDYYGASFLDHLHIAGDSGLTAEVFDSFNTSSDIDEAQDLVELYIHGKGKAAEYLRSFMALDVSKGRVKVARDVQKVTEGQRPGRPVATQ